MADKMVSEAMLKQADSVWKMLNDLADNDPQGYKKFMQKTLKEGAQHFKPPQLCFCICTVFLPEVLNHKIFVNICGWDKVPGPKTDQDPIPVIAGPIEEESFDSSPYSVVDVVFNNDILKDIEHKKDYCNLLVHLALDYLEEKKHCKLLKKYKALRISYKGNSSKLTRFLRTPIDGKCESSNPEENAASTLDNETLSKDSLLKQLSSIAVSDEKENDGITLVESNTTSPKGLIEEISSTELNTSSNSALKTPIYSMHLKNSETKGASCQLMLELTVDLPGVSSVNECALDVSEVDLLLEVNSQYRLEIDLPKKIEDSRVYASFNKTNKTLTVKLPVRE